MDQSTQTFLAQRARIRSIAYRMLGSVADAEDVVQDVWLRWQQIATDEIETPEAWLVTAATRVAIDRLRSLKRSRESYPGIWLPAPVLTGGPGVESPEDELERLGEVSAALLSLLERLTPEARAAFLLREVFDAEYGEIAKVLDKSEANFRRLVTRAKRALAQNDKPRPVPTGAHRALVEAFAAAATSGRFDAIQDLLTADARLRGDGGGRVRSVAHPLRGARRIAQLYLATFLRYRDRQQVLVVELNGAPALMRFVDGRLESTHAMVIERDRIAAIDVQRNPDKLTHLRLACERPDGIARSR